MKLPHHVCPNCGYYNGRLAIELKPAADDAPRADAVTGPRTVAASGRRAASASPSTRWAATTAPSEVVPGALDYARAHPDDRLILVGDEAVDPRPLAATRCRPTSRSSTRPQVIGMDEHPALALREKKDSSILVAIDLVKRGEADAVVTAGHTGAGMAAAVLRLGPPARASTGRPSRSR